MWMHATWRPTCMYLCACEHPSLHGYRHTHMQAHVHACLSTHTKKARARTHTCAHTDTQNNNNNKKKSCINRHEGKLYHFTLNHRIWIFAIQSLETDHKMRDIKSTHHISYVDNVTLPNVKIIPYYKIFWKKKGSST